MSQGDWKEQRDLHASGESKRYAEMPLDELMANFRAGKAALLKPMRSNAFEPVELSSKRGDQMEKNLKKLETLLAEKIGPRK